MSLSSGTRLGAYEIAVQIGEGGMGEVYRARDTKLNRDVAIKVLSASFAGDPDRLARFEREAQVLASLNHPNIAQIYGVEEANGASALVMELVEGDDLSVLIARPSTRAQGVTRRRFTRRLRRLVELPRANPGAEFVSKRFSVGACL